MIKDDKYFTVFLYVLPAPWHEVPVHILLVPSLITPLADASVPTYPVTNTAGFSSSGLLYVNIYFQAVLLLLFLHFSFSIFCSHTSAIYGHISITALKIMHYIGNIF